MHWLTACATAAIALAFASPASAQEQQHPFAAHHHVDLQGRFLHFTDIHLDPHYQHGATLKSGCHHQPKRHRKKKMRQGKLAGYWGSPTSDCDSARPWVHHAIDIIAEDWKDKIDFIVWTGDNARHGLNIPRTGDEIVALNEEVTSRLRQAFRRADNRTVPIVPCIGNNDVHPHNQLQSTSSMLNTYSKLWSDLIPLDQQDVFRQGGYFAVDVAPGIRVLSLNTLYFFNSNDEVLTCKHANSAGRRHLDWMRAELTRAREGHARVYMIGHVPPSARTFYSSCLSAYTQLALEFQDVIAAHLYGHVNYDHFIVLQQQQQQQQALIEDVAAMDQKTKRYIAGLKHQYQQVRAGDQDKALVVHVAPPILPLYYPGYRVNEYNADRTNNYGVWTRYDQYYCNLTYWNNERSALPRFELEYSTDKTYGMHNLTVASWLDLAHRMTRDTKEGRALWATYVDNVVVQT